MKFITPKNAKTTKKLAVKLPAALFDKIDALDQKVQQAGFQVDWEQPVAELLSKIANGVEKDLKDLATGRIEPTGAQADI